MSWKVVIAIVVLMGSTLPAHGAEDAWRVYVGTYTGGDSEGIYLLDFDAKTGQLTKQGVAAETENPSFLALHPDLPILYAVGEMSTGGTVSAYRIEVKTGALELLNQQPSQGPGPCHVAVSPDGGVLAVANYGGGSVAVFPVDESGRLAEATALFQHEGSGPNERRQEKAHAHAVVFSDNGRYLVAADLGTDQLRVYRHDSGTGEVVPVGPPFPATAPGAGPRHFAFHPSEPWAYSVNELDNTVTVFAWGENGSLDALQTVDTLPEGFDEPNTTAEIAIHPGGRFLYASNRGHDSIAVFEIDEATGRLTAKGQTKTGGRTPRNFAVAPSGKFLLAANQETDNVVVFRIDTDTGALEATGTDIDVPTPVCVVFHRP